MLKIVLQILQKNNASINNVDLTIIAEEPRIYKFKDSMKNQLSAILNIATSRINIKATTCEKLGFIGRKEGIACQAIATLTLTTLC
jgi:2-C-methyl-D-erythritol 2,4-cyclodiphosphate synthase